MSERRLDGAALRDWAHTCVGDLIAHSDEINTLNVFPVADADTGTNMLFTMRSAASRADAIEERGLGAVAGALAAGALRGARGNSGVILSQILRAVADVTGASAADAVDAALFAAMLRRAVDQVVAAMGGVPVAGTIVSVLEAAAEAAEDSAQIGAGLPDAVAIAADAAAVALDRTPEQLAVLAEAGVVDSGGRGLLVLLDALCATVSGVSPTRPVFVPNKPAATRATELQSAPAYEVMYVLAHCDPARVDELRVRLEALGDSVVIAAAPDAGYSVHVHADDAGAAVEAALDIAVPSRIQISALNPGSSGVAPSSWARERAVLAVVDGDGAARLFADEGAAVLRSAPSGQQPAISARQLLRAVIDTGAASVLVLPNGYVAAEELVAGCTAAIGWGVDVVPVPTRSMVQGLAALAVHDPGRHGVDDGYTMAAAAGATRFGSVRVADQEALTWAGPCRVGDGLGIFGDEVLVVRHDVVAAGRGLIDLLLGVGGELVTVLVGAGVEEHVAVLLTEHVQRHHLGSEVVTYPTGHLGDALIIGVE